MNIRFKWKFGYIKQELYWVLGKSVKGQGHTHKNKCKNKYSERQLQKFTSDLNEILDFVPYHSTKKSDEFRENSLRSRHSHQNKNLEVQKLEKNVFF